MYDKVNNSIPKSQIKLESEDLCIEDLVNVLREAAVHLYEKENKKPDEVNIVDINDVTNNIKEEINGEKGEKEVKTEGMNMNGNLQIINGKGESEKENEKDREIQRKLFVNWSTSIGLLLENEDEGEDEKEEE